MDGQAGLCLCCSQTLKTGFLTSRPIYNCFYEIIMISTMHEFISVLQGLFPTENLAEPNKYNGDASLMYTVKHV